LPAALREAWLVRHLGHLVAGLALLVGLLLPLLITNGAAVTLTGVIGFAIVGSSVGLLVGSSGQLTLGQFAVAAMGAVASEKIATRTGNYVLAFAVAAAVGAVVCLVLGLPALRSRGLLLTVVTLSFAIVTPDWLLGRSSLLGSEGVDPGRPVIFGHPLVSGHSYYLFALAVLVITLLLVANVRGSGLGRQMNAVRDNEDNARAFSLSAMRVKAYGYLVAGALAGIGGATYAHALTRIDSSTFPVSASIDVVVMAVIGGVSLLSGPLLGALFVIAIPAFVPLDSAGLAATALGQLIVILYLPRGLGQIVEPLRDALARRLAGSSRKRKPSAALPSAVGAIAARRPAAIDNQPDRSVVLAAEELHKSFGGLLAVDAMSLRLYAGETLGLIGPNGAGKTTTFELLSGFVRADSGRVLLNGRDITSFPPERRARAGLVRSFQDAALFPTMTVADTLLLSLERNTPTHAWRGVFGFPDHNRSRRRRADELIEMLRLGDYRDRQIRELSTGTRRITELACLIGMQPNVMLLDEPSSGIAQRETEALGALLADVRRELDAAMIVIEHDIPLIMSVSDRILAMSAGRLIAEGPPEVIRTDDAVVHSYLGMDRVAIERSGAAVSP
jgi:ABC-type branched-subunit amino acid transport system ATPase component/ABC-type branched-subunit amino acid transport system permease subunit